MKMKFFKIFISLLILSNLSFAEEEFPQYQGFVNDFAQKFTPEYKRNLSLILQVFRDKLGVEMVVVTMPSLGDSDIDDYATRLYEKWKIGKKETDEGLLILVAEKERKVRIEVGYGLEGILPDGKVGAILDEYVIPQLRTDNYPQAVRNAIAASAEIIAKEKNISLENLGMKPRSEKRTKPFGIGALLVLLFIFLLLGRRGGLLPMILFASMMGGGRGFGGGFGGGGFPGFGGGMSGGGGSSRGF